VTGDMVVICPKGHVLVRAKWDLASRSWKPVLIYVRREIRDVYSETMTAPAPHGVLLDVADPPANRVASSCPCGIVWVPVRTWLVPQLDLMRRSGRRRVVWSESEPLHEKLRKVRHRVENPQLRRAHSDGR
jgi:hypothetical protein